MEDLQNLNSWIEISRSAYLENLAFFRRLVGAEVELSAVVKANAYGHGFLEIAGLAREGGADSFCVHALEEAMALREAGFRQDVLIMGHVPLARIPAAVPHDFRFVLYNRESAEALAAAARARDRRVKVHLKLETGTHRQGVEAADLEGFIDFLKAHPELWLEGVYTHFANIEDTTDHGYAGEQLGRFESLVERLHAAGFSPLRRHTACSAAMLVVPRTRFEMVRLGISQYGFWPSKETYLSYHHEHPRETADRLRPVLTWKARISQLKDVPAGSFVGYGCTYQATRETRLAILPVGYADGYDRLLSNRAWVLVRGRRAPVRGRVCMNLLMVDVTDIPDVALEDEVVLLGEATGEDGDQRVSAEDLAGLIGTIPYEIVARLAPSLPRVVVD